MPTFDTQIIRDSVNVRDLIGRDLGKPEFSSNKYDAYRCVLHNESKGHSLVVYDDHWKCFGKCNESGDAIKWMMNYHHMVFSEACTALLGNSIHQSPPRPQTEQRSSEKKQANPPPEWQHYATQVVERAQEILWSNEGKPAMNYLKEQRGLGPMIIEDAKLGYLPGHFKQWHVFDEHWKKPTGEVVRVPAGITIPHIADKQLWGVKVRRAGGDIKYQNIPGGVKCLYWADEVEPSMPIFLTEGEFDCLVVDQCAGDLVCPVSICSAANYQIDSRWLMKFIRAPEVFARLDDDDAGRIAAAELGKFTYCLRLVQVPTGKDVTDFYLSAGGVGFNTVRNWVKEVTQAEQHIREGIQIMREAGMMQ